MRFRTEKFLAVLFAILLFVTPGWAANAVDSLAPIFWLESLAVVAFGVSWLTKGEAILKDEEG